MTDRERQMIEAYLPHPREADLDPFDYYAEDARGRAVTVHIGQIGYSRDNRTIYQVRTDSGRLVHGCWESEPDLMGGGWYTMSHLYDNREDCLHGAHSMFGGWEELRKLQREEAIHGEA